MKLSQFFPIPRRAIVIDDNAGFAETLKAIITRRGFEVIVLTDPGFSYDLLLDDSDLVFLDVLPSGLQVLEQLARQEARCGIVLMSGALESLEGAEKYATSLDLNLIGALEKPFKISDIKDLLGRVL